MGEADVKEKEMSSGVSAQLLDTLPCSGGRGATEVRAGKG